MKKILVPTIRFPEFLDAGDWEEKTLDQCLDYLQPTAYLVSDTNYNNAYKTPVLTAGKTFILGYTNETHGIFNENLPAIIFDDFTTATQFVNFPFKAKSSAMKILLAKNGANIKFMYELLQVINYEVGVHERHWISKFAPMSILIPLPSEQQKIADCLSSIDELINSQSQKVEALKIHKKSLVQNLFPKDGETSPLKRFPEFQNEGEWSSSTLGDIATITSGGTPSRSKPEYWNGDIPWITTSLIDFNIIQGANEFISAAGLKESSAKIFPKNTILMAMYGQGITRGKVAVMGIDAATNQACAALLLKKDIKTDFVFQNLASRYEEIRELSNKGGQENLSGGLIEKISFSFPNSVSEQQKIADCLFSIDELILVQSQKVEALKSHKKGLMQALFPTAAKVMA